MGSRAPRVARPPVPRGRTRNGTGASGPVRRLLGRDLLADLELLCDRPTIGSFDVCQNIASIGAAAVLGTLIGHGIGPLLAWRKSSIANMVPVRPKPDCTSSAMMTPPAARTLSAALFR